MNEFIQRANTQLSLPCEEVDSATVEGFLEEAVNRLEYLQKALTSIGREDILRDCERIAS
jgi:hypothetical protein